MPDDRFFGKALIDKVKSGEIDEKIVNDSVFRILYPMFKIGIFDKPNDNTLDKNVTSEEHNKAVRNISIHSTILLKNANNLLPLDD